MTEELRGRRVVVPETRELGQLLRMLQERGADTVPCPMIAIRDTPDTARCGRVTSNERLPAPVLKLVRRLPDP